MATDDEPLKWELELDAKLDGPKESIPVLERLDQTLKKLDASLDANAKKTKQDGDEHEKSAKKAHTFAAKLDEVNKKLQHLTAFQVFEFGFDKALELAKELAAEIVKIGKEAITAAAHEERLNKSFALQLGGKEAAAEVLEYLDQLGTKTEFVDDETKGFGQSLIKAGFAVKDLPHAMAAIADLAAFSGDKIEGASSALEALTRIQRTGVVDNRSLKPFGLGEDQLIAVLKERGHKGDTEAIKKLLSDGKIDRQELLQSVYQTITSKTGKLLGGAGAEMGQTLEARLHRLGNLPEMYFEKWASSPGFQVFSDQIEALFQKLDPESGDGQRIFAALDKALTGLTEVVEKFLTPEGIDNFVSGIKTTIDVIGSLIRGIKEVIDLLNGETISKALFTGDKGDQRVSGIESLRQMGYAGDEEIERAIAAMGASERDDLLRQGKAHGFDYSRFMPRKGGAPPALDGTGLAGRAPAFEIVGAEQLDVSKASGKAVAEAHLDGVKEGLDAHSPSRKMAELGRFASLGFAQGIESGAGMVRDSFDTSLAIRPPQLGRGGLGGGGASIAVSGPLVVIEYKGGSGDDAEAVARRVEEILPSALASALEQLNLELGAGAPEEG